MSKTRSEAERLLNTIVSSRVRLNALQGDSSASVEPSLAEDKEGLPDIEQATENQATIRTREEDLFADLPIEDELTEFEEPPRVLGIVPESEIEDQDPLKTFSENTEPTTIDVPPDLAPDRPPPTVALDTSQPANSSEDEELLRETTETIGSIPRTLEPDNEEADPFSFIDLIPPDSDISTTDSVTQDPKDTAPPIRTKPLMPLPSPEAAGAPPASTKPHAHQQRHAEQALSTGGLAKPKEVAPRLLDPDRATLEVDVYVEQDDEPFSEPADQPLPLLTDTPSSTATPVVPAKAPVQTESVFDIVTEGLNALSRGDLHTAVDRLSDALDWEPNNVEALLARGRCKRDQGNIAGAMSDFLKAEDIAPHSCEPYVEIGDLFFAKKDYNRAITHYTEALSIHPGHAMALCRRGISYHHRRQAAQALDDLKGAKSLDADIPNIDRYINMVMSRRQSPIRR